MFGLTFLNASILIAIFATVIPLLIHLFIKIKPQKVFFSSLRFLREIIEEKKKRMSLNQLLLLILRMFIIFFTILAISRPVVKLPFINKGNYHPPTAVAFILDTSPSMDYIINQRTQIQHGIEIIKNIQNEMNSRDASYLLTSDITYNSLRSRLIYGTIPDRDFHDINVTWIPEPMNQLLERAQLELANSRFLHKEIYVISDLQQTDLPKEFEIPVSFISTFTDSIRINLSIENAVVKKELIAGTSQRIVEFDVVNYSPLHQMDQIVRLHINGTTVAEKIVDLQPFEKKTDLFIINNESLEWNWGWVEVRNDRFLPDNRYYFTFYSDPEPKIGVIVDTSQNIFSTQIGIFPKPIEILAELFLGENGTLEYIQPDNLQLSDREKYHFLIFYLANYSSRIQSLIKELNNHNFQSMFIFHPDMTEHTFLFFKENYGFNMSNLYKKELQPINAFHHWHRLMGNFDFSTQIPLYSAPVFAIELGLNASPLVNTKSAPLLVENKDIFVNVDFSMIGQNFLTHPSFPIVIYRSFSWVSKYDGALNSYLIGDTFPYRQGILTSPSGNDYDTSVSTFRFNEPGVWVFKDQANNQTFLSVNMFDFENQSKHNPIKDMELENMSLLGKDYQTNILQADKGNEIWKILLWTVFIFLLIEMFLVMFLQRKARV